jgi:hypothetical protein
MIISAPARGKTGYNYPHIVAEDVDVLYKLRRKHQRRV